MARKVAADVLNGRHIDDRLIETHVEDKGVQLAALSRTWKRCLDNREVFEE